MSTNSVRYLVEHVALRDALFTAGPRVILDFMGNPGPAMMNLYEKLGKKSSGYECPYTENCFSKDILKHFVYFLHYPEKHYKVRRTKALSKHCQTQCTKVF